MTHYPDEIWANDLAYHITAGNHDGLTWAEMRDRFVAEGLKQLEFGELELLPRDKAAELGQAFDRYAKPMLKMRRRRLVKDEEWIVDAIDDPEMAGPYQEACLALPCPIGDGRIKELGLWTPEDWDLSVATSAKNLAEVAAAHAEHAANAAKIKARLTAHGAKYARAAIYGGNGD